MLVKIVQTIAEVYLFIYDVVTYPIYELVIKMTRKKRVKDNTTPKAYMVKESSEEIIWRRDVSNKKEMYKEIIIDNEVGLNVLLIPYYLWLYANAKIQRFNMLHDIL